MVLIQRELDLGLTRLRIEAQVTKLQARLERVPVYVVRSYPASVAS